jgi:hypothetical protein
LVNPLENFTVKASPFGASIDIAWLYPALAPANKRAYLFRRSKNDVSDEEITTYFNTKDHTNYAYNGLMVYDQLNQDTNALGDNRVLNDTIYFYKAVLKDEDLGEYSTAVSGNAISRPSLKVNVKDGKEIVELAFTKLFDNIYSYTGEKVQLGKDIQIIRHFSIEPIAQNYVMIERVNGSTQYQFWGNELFQYSNMIVKGDIDLDVIRVTFITQESPERRDTMANIIRANKQFLIYICKRLGVKNCTITIEGDYYNPQVHGVNAVGFVTVFSLLIENKSVIPAVQWESIIGNLTVKDKL